MSAGTSLNHAQIIVIKINFRAGLAAAALLVLQVGGSWASTAAGTVNNIWSMDSASGSVFAFSVNGTINSKPTCNSQNRYMVSLQNDAGRAIKDSVLSAKASGLTVTVTGTGACTVQTTSENINFITVSGNPVSGTSTSRSSAVCVSASYQAGNGECGCSGRIISKVYTATSCAVSSDTGDCTAAVSGYYSGNNPPSVRASCCVCAP